MKFSYTSAFSFQSRDVLHRLPRPELLHLACVIHLHDAAVKRGHGERAVSQRQVVDECGFDNGSAHQAGVRPTLFPGLRTL